MTIIEALEITLGVIENIPITMKEAERIGRPLSIAADNIREMIKAAEKQDAGGEEQAPEEAE